jgi:hypothetical protein
LKLGFESLDRHRLDGKKVKEERSIGTGGEADELAFVALCGLHMVVDLHEVGRLTTDGGSVVNDLNLEFLACLVDDGHRA